MDSVFDIKDKLREELFEKARICIVNRNFTLLRRYNQLIKSLNNDNISSADIEFINENDPILVRIKEYCPSINYVSNSFSFSDVNNSFANLIVEKSRSESDKNNVKIYNNMLICIANDNEFCVHMEKIISNDKDLQKLYDNYRAIKQNINKDVAASEEYTPCVTPLDLSFLDRAGMSCARSGSSNLGR
jgi:hypothetical protein